MSIILLMCSIPLVAFAIGVIVAIIEQHAYHLVFSKSDNEEDR